MRVSGQIFQNSMIPATGAALCFIFNNPLGGWCLTGVACIGFLTAFLIYRKEKKEE